MATTAILLFFMATTVLIGGGGAMLSPGDGGPGVLRSSDFGYMSGIALGMLVFGATCRHTRSTFEPPASRRCRRIGPELGNPPPEPP